MTTASTTLTLSERARAAYRKRKEDDARKRAEQHESERRECQFKLAEILGLPLDSIVVKDGPPDQWAADHPHFSFEATVEGLRFVFRVFSNRASDRISVHVVPDENIPGVVPAMLENPLEHYSSAITCLADLGSQLDYFEPHYL